MIISMKEKLDIIVIHQTNNNKYIMTLHLFLKIQNITGNLNKYSMYICLIFLNV